jgi:hypothetical protein
LVPGVDPLHRDGRLLAQEEQLLFTRSITPLAVLAVIGLTAAQPASAAGSVASGLFANFTVDGINTAISPVNRLSSAGLGPNYNKSINSGLYHRQLVLSPVSDFWQPILTVNAANLLSHIRGGFGVDTVSEVGAALATDLTLNLLPKGGPPEPPIVAFLLVSAHGVLERGSYNNVAPAFTTVSGFAGIKDLAISGTLVGNKTLRFTGSPKENQVLYQSPTVTITLNRTISTDVVLCDVRCVVTPVRVSTGGLVISLNNAPIGPRKVTGHIIIGAAEAGIEGTF